MTDLDMLVHLLKKSGRIYDRFDKDDKTIIQIHVADIRYEFDFDSEGFLEEDWDNDCLTSWISEGAYLYD